MEVWSWPSLPIDSNITLPRTFLSESYHEEKKLRRQNPTWHKRPFKYSIYMRWLWRYAATLNIKNLNIVDCYTRIWYFVSICSQSKVIHLKSSEVVVHWVQFQYVQLAPPLLHVTDIFLSHDKRNLYSVFSQRNETVGILVQFPLQVHRLCTVH